MNPRSRVAGTETPATADAGILRRNHAAADFFERLAPTYRREYLIWLTHAKRPETRAQRLDETIAALADGRKWLERKRAVSKPVGQYALLDPWKFKR